MSDESQPNAPTEPAEPTDGDADDELGLPGLPDDDGEPPITEPGVPMPV